MSPYNIKVTELSRVVSEIFYSNVLLNLEASSSRRYLNERKAHS